jgi:hypothetical protein
MSWRKIDDGRNVCWVCDHGIRHPDTKSIAVMCGFDQKTMDEKTRHECDGCCTKADFPGRVNVENFRKQ